MDWLSYAERLRKRAEELRVAAAIMTFPETGDAFLRLAADYDDMAAQAERLSQQLGNQPSAGE